MAGIDRNRMLLGGLAAGLVITVGEFILNGPVAGAAFNAAMLQAGLVPPDARTIVMYVAMAFAIGITAVWMYTAIRPRYGPGPATAIRAALVVWVLGYLFPSISLGTMGIFPPNLIGLAIAWGLVEVPLAAVAGAWVYREAEAPAAEPAVASGAPTI